MQELLNVNQVGDCRSENVGPHSLGGLRFLHAPRKMATVCRPDVPCLLSLDYLAICMRSAEKSFPCFWFGLMHTVKCWSDLEMHFSNLQAAQYAHHVTKDHTHRLPRRGRRNSCPKTTPGTGSEPLSEWMNVSACFALKALGHVS